jgi:cold shock protein
MATGRVKWFNATKGFGFIQVDGRERDTDVFVHCSQIMAEGYKQLNEGDHVEFVIGTTPKGERAENVSVIT